MNPFSFEVAGFPKVVFGPGSVLRVGEETARLGRRAFVLTGKGSARRTGLLDRVVKSLREQSLAVDVFEGIEPNPRLETIRVAAQQATGFGADVVVAVGGGSVMDAAKGLTTELAYPGRMWDFVLRGAQTLTPERSLPIVTVPTTAATGSETNPTGVITWWEKHEKMPLINPAALPKVALMDPELTLTLSPQTTRDGAADILAHLLETYVPSPEMEPQDSFTEGSFRAVVAAAAALEKDPADLGARCALLWANNCAMTFVCQAGRTGAAWSYHFIEHVVSGHYDVTHGAGLAALAEAWLLHCAKTVPDRVAKLGKNVFGTEGPEAGARAVGAYLRSIGFGGLASLGVPAGGLERMADDAVRCYGWDAGRIPAPEPLTRADVLAILRASL